jgi:5-methylcytosine-specific restriction protein A
VNLRYERILNPEIDEILPMDRLQNGPLASVYWTTPASGIEIKYGVEELERLWTDLVEKYDVFQSDAEEPGAMEGEMRIALTRHRARERWLRDEKIARSKAAHNGRLPCEICGFDFFETYGEIGRDYAQVHHRKPLGDRTKPSLTSLEELAVVCANCHAMIHRDGRVRALGEIIAGETGPTAYKEVRSRY